MNGFVMLWIFIAGWFATSSFAFYNTGSPLIEALGIGLQCTLWLIMLALWLMFRAWRAWRISSKLPPPQVTTAPGQTSANLNRRPR